MCAVKLLRRRLLYNKIHPCETSEEKHRKRKLTRLLIMH